VVFFVLIGVVCFIQFGAKKDRPEDIYAVKDDKITFKEDVKEEPKQKKILVKMGREDDGPSENLHDSNLCDDDFTNIKKMMDSMCHINQPQGDD